MGLRHVGCKGAIVVNLSKSILLLTPSYGFTLESGFTVGQIEMTPSKSVENASFVCTKCYKELDADSEELEITCMCCKKFYKVSNILVTREIPYLCKKCVKEFEEPISGETSSKVLEFKSFISSVDSSSAKPLLEIMKKKISF